MSVEWGLEVAAYLFLAGLGAGAYLAAVAASRMDREKYAAFSAAGIHLSWIVTIVGIGALFLHLGRPERFINAYSNLGSWITLGTWILTFFIGAGILNSLFLTRVKVSEGISSAVQFIGGVLAFLTAIYTGIVISILNAKPLWYSPLIPWLFVVSALSTGIVAMGMLMLRKPEQREVVDKIDRTDIPLIIVEIAVIAAFLATVGAKDAVENLIYSSLSRMFLGGVLLIGLLIPLGLSVYAEKKKPLSPSVLTLGFACVLIGGFALRYVILLAGQT